MNRLALALLALAAPPVFPDDGDWPPTPNVTRDLSKVKDLEVRGRRHEIYEHGVRKEWGYKAPQKDLFIVVHPKTGRARAPLYVVLHSAGHDVISCLQCTKTVGNHDIYHSPEDFFALYLDCRANKGDWWWGGMHAKDAGLTQRNSGGDPTPVERRVIDSVQWVVQKYGIDPNRVYLSGNSMGGSGTLGIGLRHGDVFAAIKANVPAGIEHVSHRMYFPPQAVPDGVRLPDPPVAVDYSAPNDGWSFGHERFAKAMNDRKYALYFYWGPFGHANNHAAILKVNDLVNSFDWLNVRKDEAYPAFTNASCNSAIPWPDRIDDKAPGQVNAFFRWKNMADTREKVGMELFLTAPDSLKTTFEIPKEATADVTLRRVQNLQVKPGETLKWSFGTAKGQVKADAEGLVTVAGLKISATPATLSVGR
jgi:pimeloyl-ACP methyl ester carboxylesterase